MQEYAIRGLDPELARRANTILCKLKLLGEAKSSGRISAVGHQQKADASAPPETNLKNPDQNQPPPKDRSLYDWYLWHFSRARNEYKWRLLCYLAERDYERYVKRPPDRGPLTLRGKDGEEAEREGMKRIVEWYAGLDAQEVAILEECSAEHVKKARRVFRKQESDGREVPGWRGMSEEGRYEVITEYRLRGLKQFEVAGELGVSERTLRKYWKKNAANGAF
jgi:predicted Fe-S protein YdhL (DUF1289 family)